MSNNHSKIPWIIGQSCTRHSSSFNISGDTEWSIYSGKDRVAISVMPPIKNNAEFIVRACNSHDEMVDAIKMLTSKISDAGRRSVTDCGQLGVYLTITEIDQLRAALNKAIGGDDAQK